MTTLSVLIPVYNAAPYLQEMLDSVLQQSMQADQIVIVNDGSTDQSLEVLTAYQRREGRILLIDQPNGGVSRARNAGLTHCEGEFVALMDSDDICLPERFETQITTMRDQRADICGSWLQNFGASSRLNKYPACSDQLKWNYLFFGRTIPNPSCIFRRASIGETRYMDGLAFGEDYAFFLTCLINNPKILLTNVSKPLVHYRIHSSQASRRLKEQNLSNLKAIQEQLVPHPLGSSLKEILPLHFKIWKHQQALTEGELSLYLPLMAFWSDWLSQEAQAPSPAASHWLALMKRHRSAGSGALKQIRQYAQPYVPAWRGIAERLIAGFR